MIYAQKVKYLIVSFSILIFQNLTAQTDDDISNRHCYTYEYNKALQAKHPDFKMDKHADEEDEAIAAGLSFTGSDSIYTIPVVFHVVYNKSAENIPNEQIASQIDVLNEDFSGSNLDIVNVPDPFKHVKAGDVGVRFCLATLDPDNNPTNGVIRTKTDTTLFYPFDDNVKSTLTGGDDPWPADKYLNVWVCNLSGSVLGYATYPGGSGSSDGVVVFYKAVGRMGTAVKPYNKGRTLTHEVGHWLNLKHIWCEDIDVCCNSDNVGDTPKQSEGNFGCPSFPQISCDNGPNGNMFMNYMDYTDDSCMCLFTAGQRKRMMHALDSLRPEIKLSKQTNCSPLDPKTDYNVLIVPNPNNGNFIIRFKKTIPQNFELDMYDMLGHIVYTTKITGIDSDIETGIENRNIYVQCDNLTKGIYFLKTNSDDHAYNYKVVIFRN